MELALILKDDCEYSAPVALNANKIKGKRIRKKKNKVNGYHFRPYTYPLRCHLFTIIIK